MINLNSVPASVADLVTQLQDQAIPLDKRQNYRKSVEDIRTATTQAIVRFDAEVIYRMSKPIKKKVRVQR